MKHRMLNTADIHINRQIFVRFLAAHQFLVVFIVHIAEEVPGGAGPLRHGIGLSLRRRAADRAGGIYPPVNVGQRGFSRSCRLIGFHLGKKQRKLILRHRYAAALRAVNNRDRLAPVTLAGEYPVTQLIINCFAANSHFFNHHRCFFLEHRAFHAVPFAGIDHGAGSIRIGFFHIFDFLTILGNYLDYRNIEFSGKFKVSVIMGGNAHNRARAIICKHVIGKPDRNLCAV